MGKLYVGINGTATKVKRLYVGVNGIARKIKKMYVGVNGIARKVFGGELKYYGTATALSRARSEAASTTAGEYAFFAGGHIYNGVVSVVDAYNKSLTLTTPNSFGETYGSRELGAATAGEYALFAGGNGSTGQSNLHKQVRAYDGHSLVKTNATALSLEKFALGGAAVGDYAVFAGGFKNASEVIGTAEGYNSSLVKVEVASLTTSRAYMFSASNEAAAFFAGGTSGTGKSVVFYSAIDAYDDSLTLVNPANLSVARYDGAATSVNGYVIFAGGNTSRNSAYNQTVDAYDRSLTKKTVSDLSVARFGLGAATVEDFAIFAGGYSGSGRSKVVDVYDGSLTKLIAPSDLPAVSSRPCGGSIGEYALIAGGQNNASTSNSYKSTVYAYQVS